MKAILIKDAIFSINQSLEIEGNSFHHLKVTRACENDSILLLNGNGEKAISKITSMSKKSALVKIESVEKTSKFHQLKIYLAPPKKDATEEIIKHCVELGITELVQVKSKFSQYEIIENERIQNIIESAMVQSNHPFMLKIGTIKSFENFLNELKSPIICFSSTSQISANVINPKEIGGFLIGPEGGFSIEEEELLKKSPMIQMIHLNLPIMRSPTATCAAMGYLVSLTHIT